VLPDWLDFSYGLSSTANWTWTLYAYHVTSNNNQPDLCADLILAPAILHFFSTWLLASSSIFHLSLRGTELQTRKSSPRVPSFPHSLKEYTRVVLWNKDSASVPVSTDNEWSYGIWGCVVCYMCKSFCSCFVLHLPIFHHIYLLLSPYLLK